MKAKMTLLLGFIFLAAAFPPAVVPQAQDAKIGKGDAAITRSFASPTLRPGDTWKIYLKASAPQGEMKNIYALVDQPGVGPYPVSIVGIQQENNKELSGYIYLNTATPRVSLEFVALNLTVQIQDALGNFSRAVVFPLSFSSRAAQEVPPPGVFAEQDLGPIMVTLRIVDEEGPDQRRRRK